MNERTGDLILSGSVDREAVEEINLKVMAKNRGPIRGNDTDIANVRVVVRDANDPPLFTERVYQGIVRENAESGTSVIKVRNYFLLSMNVFENQINLIISLSNNYH